MLVGNNLGTNSWEKFTEEKRESNFLVCVLEITVMHLHTTLLHAWAQEIMHFTALSSN